MSDPVNHPSHYTSGRIEVIDAIEDWKLGMHLGNAVKYIARAGKKDPFKLHEDLKKSIWYIERFIQITTPKPISTGGAGGCGPFEERAYERKKDL